MADFYDILGVEPNATAEEIKEAWAVKRQIHPDRYQKEGQKKYAEAQFQRTSAAFDVLGDPDKRREYDATLGMQSQYNEPPPHHSRPQHSAGRPQYEPDEPVHTPPQQSTYDLSLSRRLFRWVLMRPRRAFIAFALALLTVWVLGSWLHDTWGAKPGWGIIPVSSPAYQEVPVPGQPGMCRVANVPASAPKVIGPCSK